MGFTQLYKINRLKGILLLRCCWTLSILSYSFGCYVLTSIFILFTICWCILLPHSLLLPLNGHFQHTLSSTSHVLSISFFLMSSELTSFLQLSLWWLHFLLYPPSYSSILLQICISIASNLLCCSLSSVNDHAPYSIALQKYFINLFLSSFSM